MSDSYSDLDSDLPYAEGVDTYTGIRVISTDELHGSGYRIMRVIGEKEDGSCCILADSADVIYWTFSNSNYLSSWIRGPRESMKMDCDRNFTHYFGARFVVEPSTVSDVYIEVHPKTRAS